ncbi:MAG TPA: tetratricopeptide repeat protein [Chloroflexota bacterium]|nr:tetratricopeptide repeat protein [Chloroflexota bacterium]
MTFLMTDIEGSSLLYEQDELAARLTVARHNELMTGGIERRDGAVIRPRAEGDSIFAVFARVTDAVTAALEIQQALHQERWPTGTPLRVRMALYTGEAELRNDDYFGAVVNRCARMRDAAHGGQVLLASITAEMARGALPAAVDLRDLGEHRFRNIAQPERVFQLLHPDLPSEFPPIRSLKTFSTNLPSQLTSFVGRERELAEVKQHLEESRLLSLIGTGGAGKTRLALQAASDLLETFPDGVWLVELAALSDPDLVPSAVVAALGLSQAPSRPAIELLVEHLQARAPLLVLDNCEHLIAACARLAERLLRTCPRLRILVTSREPLGIAGEIAFRVPSLALPELPPRSVGSGGLAGRLPGAAVLCEYESVRLFVDRAQAVQPGFPVTDQSAQAIAKICQRLDGIPLALELAAARVKVLTIDQIATRLDDRFRLLTGGARTALRRQQTLRAAIDWSYDLLGEAERAVLRRLAVFAGGWTLEAAEAVCPAEDVDVYEVLDLLSQLVDKSLVLVIESSAGESRYRLLETVRQYAHERLAEAGETATDQQRHLDWLVALAERAETELRGPRQVEWMDRLEAEQDNVRAALTWGLTQPAHTESTLRLVGALYRFWQVRHIAEGLGWLTQALDAVSSSGQVELSAVQAPCAKAAIGAGVLARDLGELQTARCWMERSLAVRRALGDRWGIGQVLNNLATIETIERNYEAARTTVEESVAIWRELGDPWGLARALGNLGELLMVEGDVGAATATLDECLTLARSINDVQLLSWQRHHLAGLLMQSGKYRRAEELLLESEALQREMHDQYALGRVLSDLGLLATRRGDYTQAAHRLRESVELFSTLGNLSGLAQALWRLAELEAVEGRADRAARLLGAATALQDRAGADTALTQPDADDVQARIQAMLGERAYLAARLEGQAMTSDQAVAFALGDRDPS